MASEEGSLTLPDGHKVYTKTWKAAEGNLKARLVFIHGFSDHCNTPEDPFFVTLAKNGIQVHSFDQRGWGRSVHEPKQKGLTGPTSQVMNDITAFVKSIPADPNTPLFLMGHSMGGAQTILYAATGPKDVLSRFRGVLVEAPFIALHKSARPWKLTVALGRLAGRLLPNMHMVNKLDSTKLARDPVICQNFVDDPLCHETGTLEGLAGMLDRAGDIEGGRVIIKGDSGEGGKTRIWVGHGTADEICDYGACKNWFDKLQVGDKQLRTYDGWYHVLHSEPGEDKTLFVNEVSKWVLDRSGPLDQLDGTKSKL